jgi:hypothetical protein
MSNSKQESKASVSTIWTDIDLDGESAKISIVNGQAKIRVDGDGFEVPVKGVFDPDDIEGVITAHKKEIADNEVNYHALKDRCLEAQCQDNDYGLIPITDEELDELIREYEKDRGQVISMKTRKTI